LNPPRSDSSDRSTIAAGIEVSPDLVSSAAELEAFLVLNRFPMDPGIAADRGAMGDYFQE